MPLCNSALVLACLVCVGQGSRTTIETDQGYKNKAIETDQGFQLLAENQQSSEAMKPAPNKRSQRMMALLAALLAASNPAAGFKFPGRSPGIATGTKLHQPVRFPSVVSGSGLRMQEPGVEPGVEHVRTKVKDTGFVADMRRVAMKLHTKDQSKEGGRESQKPITPSKPTKEGYLRFLVESKAVYDVLEGIMAKASNPVYAKFQNTGLERAAALEKDISWFKGQGMEIPTSSGPGKEYAVALSKLAEEDPPAFICHFYNQYFAHTAGGTMIGKQMSNMLLDGKTLEFYQWDGDLPEMMGKVKASINTVAKDWTEDQKKHCLEETEKSFELSGKLLQEITK